MVSSFICCVYFHSGLSLRQCQSNFIDLDMDSSSNEVTCEGAQGTETISWQFTDGGTTTGTFNCGTTGRCDDNTLFTATRTAGSTYSRLTIKENITRFRALYGSLTLTCKTSNPSNPAVTTGDVSCEIDVIRKYLKLMWYEAYSTCTHI